MDCAQIENFLDELGACDDSDVDIVNESDHNTDTEQSDNENYVENDPVPPGYGILPDIQPPQQAIHHQQPRELAYSNSNELYIAKDGTTWRHTPKRSGPTRARRCDLLRHLPGVIDEGRNADSPLKALELFFPNAMLEEIVQCTNMYIESIRANYARSRDAADITLVELKAVLGLLFLGGVMKMSHTDLLDLWKTDGTGVEFFRLTMGINRFRFIIRYLKFDNYRTRDERKVTDKIAAVRYLVDHFNDNCKKYYSLSDQVTIDEMLEAFRGRCSFRQYIPSKPAKYGLKLFALCDAKMYYTNNIEIYCGTQYDGPYAQDNDAFSIVKRLVQPIANSGRNVTCDNWFTSIPLAQDLMHNEKLTLVGTMRSNRKGIPDFMKNSKDRPVGSTIFAYKDNLTLLSFKSKRNKTVLALSTLHPENCEVPEIPDSDIHKPEIILFYNKTKSGVDKVDEMKAGYSVARITRRWTLVIFFALLNIGGINAYIVYKGNKNESLKRNDFLKMLAKGLLEDFLRARVYQENIPSTIRMRLSELMQVERERPAQQRPMAGGARGRCYFCDRKKNRPTKYMCTNCRKYICLEHVVSYLCGECNMQVQVIGPVNSSDSE